MFKKTALILSFGVLIAACGSSSKNDPASASKGARGYSQALAFSRCMREHGVSNFPDPTSSGGGVQLNIGGNSGVNPQSPAFQAAQNGCKHLLPGGGPSSGPPSPQARAHLLKVSECMRAHGITGFPDPTTTPPSPGAPGYGVVMGRDGVFLAIPNSINVQSPAFRQAAAACNFGPKGGRVASTSSGP
jgi:hypothetical protein